MPGPVVYQLKATIRGTKPPVWRRVVVPKASTLRQLHVVIQAAFGWYGYHLHVFEIGGVSYGTDDGQGWERPRDEGRARLGAVAGPGSVFDYVYDFGDDWTHKVVVEKEMTAVAGVAYPACTGGRRACPPEDCGGVWGYQDFLETVSDPDDPEHEAMLEWAGGDFDPDAFDPGDFARRLGFAQSAR
ncbi:MAG: plasmid pRiA4b ORF-3 family protein [Acidimicrobiales bacterium]